MQEPNTPQTIQLRDATPHDEPFLRELYFHVRGEEVAAWGWDQSMRQLFLEPQYNARQYGRAMYGSQLLVKIILEQQTPIDEFVILPLPNVIEIHDIALIAAYRHQGIGSSLLRTTLTQAADEGKKVSLHVL